MQKYEKHDIVGTPIKTRDAPPMPNLYETVEKKIRQEFIDGFTGRLPTVNELACHYNTSRTTITKVLKSLSRQKLINPGKPGVRARIISTDEQTGPQNVSEKAISLYQMLREQVVSAKLRTGDRMPKIRYLSATTQVGPVSIHEVFKTLEAECLVHKSGRAWVAGSDRKRFSTQATTGPSPHLSPVVLVFNSRFSLTQKMVPGSDFPRISKPFNALKEELERYGVSFVSGFAENLFESFHGFPKRTLPFIFNEGEISEVLGDLGSRYYGAVVQWGQERECTNEFVHWIKFLLKKKKPVVWIEDGKLYPRDDLLVTLRKEGSELFKHFYRSVNDDLLSVECAIQALVDTGHTRIGFVRPPTEGKDWSDIRFKDLSYLGSSKGITVHLIEDDELTVYTGWCDIGKSVREELDRAKNLASDANSGSISRKEGISPGTRILLEEIRKHNLTCLVAANDCAAEYISIKLALAGVRIPQDISLLSFDNRSESCFFPISTIDPCFDSLGYFAAHLLLKDFPVPKDRYHTVRNKPRLVNRGSLVPINIINSAI